MEGGEGAVAGGATFGGGAVEGVVAMGLVLMVLVDGIEFLEGLGDGIY